MHTKGINLNKIEEAMQWLEERLWNGPDLATNIIEDAKILEIKYDTLNNARNRLGYETVRATFGNLEWWWFNPDLLMDDPMRKAWFEKHKGKFQPYLTERENSIREAYSRMGMKNIDLCVKPFTYKEFFAEFAHNLYNDAEEIAEEFRQKNVYEQIVEDGIYYFNEKERKDKSKSVENYYKSLIIKKRKAGDTEAVERISKSLIRYENNRNVRSGDPELDVGKPYSTRPPVSEQTIVDIWLLGELEKGPCLKSSILNKAKQFKFSEEELEEAVTKLKIEIILGSENQVWWTDLDRETTEFIPVGVKSSVREQNKESRAHRKAYEKYYGHSWVGQSDSLDDHNDDDSEGAGSGLYSANKIPFSHFYNEANINKSNKNNLTTEEVEKLKVEYNARLATEKPVVKVDYTDYRHVPDTSKKVKRYKRFSRS